MAKSHFLTRKLRQKLGKVGPRTKVQKKNITSKRFLEEKFTRWRSGTCGSSKRRVYKNAVATRLLNVKPRKKDRTLSKENPFLSLNDVKERERER